MPTRQLGRFGVTDLLVLLLLAASVRMGLTGDHFTVGDAIVSATVLISWDQLMNALAYRVKPLRTLLRQDPIPIVEDGAVNTRHARKELLTETDIMEKLRERGVDSLEQVQKAYVEPDGRISVIPVRDAHVNRADRTSP